MDASDYFPQERLDRMHEYMVSFAQSFGVDIAFSKRMPNTRRALAMAEFARERGVLDKFRELAMNAYWRHGEDLENDAVLRAIAANAGLDPEAALTASLNERYQAKIDKVRAESEAIGVTGIPTMIVGTERIVGCQLYEKIATACEWAGVRRKKE
jgi:predicted DsbA family dithiol-disulfide isomerase